MKSKRIKGLIGLSLTTLLVLALVVVMGSGAEKQRADQRKLPLNKNLK